MWCHYPKADYLPIIIYPEVLYSSLDPSNMPMLTTVFIEQWHTLHIFWLFSVRFNAVKPLWNIHLLFFLFIKRWHINFFCMFLKQDSSCYHLHYKQCLSDSHFSLSLELNKTKNIIQNAKLSVPCWKKEKEQLYLWLLQSAGIRDSFLIMLNKHLLTETSYLHFKKVLNVHYTSPSKLLI